MNQPLYIHKEGKHPQKSMKQFGEEVPISGEASSSHRSLCRLSTLLPSSTRRASVLAIIIVAVIVSSCLLTMMLSAEHGQRGETRSHPRGSTRNLPGFEGIRVTVTEPPGFGEATKKIVLEDFVTTSFAEDIPTGFWANDVEYVDRNRAGDLIVTNAATGRFRTLVPAKIFANLRAEDFQPSPDLKKVLLLTEIEHRFRHTREAKYYVYDVTTGARFILTPKIDSHEPLEAVIWSPKGDSVAFVHEGDVYHYALGPPVHALHRITRDNSPGLISNGIPDWVYEEEVLKSEDSFWFDSSGTKLAFLRFDDSLVEDMVFSRYGPPGTQYPSMFSYKYPKPGTKNPLVTALVVDLTEPSAPPSLLIPPPDVVRSDYIISSAYWQPDAPLFHVTWLNRPQNVTIFSVCQGSSRGQPWHCDPYHVDNVRGGWAAPLKDPFFKNKNGTGFLQILPAEVGGEQRERFQHVFLVKPGKEPEPEQLTTGRMSVTELLGWHGNEFYFLATEEAAPSQSHVYRADLKSKVSQCVSCSWVNSRGETCSRASADFSERLSYFISRCESRFSPPEFNLTYTETMTPIRTLANNTEAFHGISSLQLPLQVDFRIPVSDADRNSAEVRLLLPPGFSSKQKYPLLVTVYAAPDYQSVTDTYTGVDFGIFVSSGLNYIHASIDGRGSAGKSRDFSFFLRHGLGTYEVEDQVNVVHKLVQQLTFIDETKVGIWGWSYGGFVAASALTTLGNPFKCAISVAPVTNWLYYDSIYTERYLGLPQENPEGYSRSNLAGKVDGFAGKEFFLVHGTADDNVHYMQSMMLAKALEKGDVLFRQMSYPDEAHDLSGVSHHFYHSMFDFWGKCFV